MEQVATLSILAGCVLADVLEQDFGARDLQLKWPNDVLLGGRKVAGVLLESVARAGVLDVVVGMGVNCAFHPDEARFPATNLSQMGYAVAPRALFVALRSRFSTALDVWDGGRDFDPFRVSWERRGYRLGQEVRIENGGATVEGIAEGLDWDGALLVRAGSDIVRVVAGDLGSRAGVS